MPTCCSPNGACLDSSAELLSMCCDPSPADNTEAHKQALAVVIGHAAAQRVCAAQKAAALPTGQAC